MKLLLTGATGFLGGRLLELLVKEGHQVRVLVRKSRKKRALPPNVEVVWGDVCNMEEVLAACADCEAAIHSAALVQAWTRKVQDFERVNVGGLKNMIEALRRTASLKRLVHVSSFFALGPTDGYVANEEQVHAGKDFCTEYERTKWLSDGIAQRAAKDGLPVVAVYPGVIYGAGELTSGNLLPQIICDHLKGRFPGYIGAGTSLTSFVYVDDVCDGIIAALEKGKPGQRYLLVGENGSFVDFFKALEELTGVSPPSIHIPFVVARSIGFLSVLIAYLGGPQPTITHETVRVFQHDWAYSSPSTCAELGYRPRSLKEGLRETLIWLKSIHKVAIELKE